MKSAMLMLVVIVVAAGSASSQIWMDAFTYPPGTNLGSWNELAGDWRATGTEAEAQVQFLWQYAVQPNRVYRDCVAQCLVIKNGGTTPHTLQFGGIALRCNSASDTVMVKVQNNSYTTNPTAFDSIYIYEQPGGSTSTLNITPTFPKAVVRLIVKDQTAIAQVDSDLDGLWDLQLVRALTNAPKTAPVGIDGFGGVRIDDFELFDAVILDATPVQRPTPGTTLQFDLRGSPSKFYQAASSLARSGIVLPDGRVIPLAADALFLLSVTGVVPGIFANYSNLLDTNGDGFVKVILPNVPALVGVTFYTAFITYDGTGIVNISNDHQVTIVT